MFCTLHKLVDKSQLYMLKYEAMSDWPEAENLSLNGEASISGLQNSFMHDG